MAKFKSGNLLVYFGLALLFFLPLIESVNRMLGVNVLLISSILINIQFLYSKRIIFDKIIFLFLLVLVIFGFSTITSWSLLRSYLNLNLYIAYFLIFLVIRNTDDYGYLKKYFILMVLVNGLILSLISLFLLISGSNFPLPVEGMSLYTRVSGHNRVADILVFAIPIAGSLLSTVKRKSFRYGLIILILIYLTALIFSFGRAAILSLALGYLLATMFLNIKSKKPDSWNLLAIILGIIAIIALLISFVYSNFLLSDTAKSKLKIFYKPVINERRLDYYSQAVRGLSLSPLFGTGLDTFIYVSQKYQQGRSHELTSSVHNRYLQYFTETGFFGGLLFLILLLMLFREALRRLPDRQDKDELIDNYFRYGLLIATVSSSIQAAIDYNWDFLSIFLFFWIGMALLLKKDEIRQVKVSSFSYLLLPVVLGVTLFLQLFVPLDSWRVLKKASFLDEHGYTDQARATLEAALQIDKLNTNLLTASAEINRKLKIYDKAHQLYHQAILLNRVNPLYLIKSDYSLYLDQIENSLDYSDNAEKEKLFVLLSSVYQPYHDKVLREIDYPDQLSTSSASLHQYLLIARNLVVQRDLTSDELEKIINKISDLEGIRL